MRVNSNIPFKYYNYSIFCICMNHFLYALLRELKGEEGGGLVWMQNYSRKYKPCPSHSSSLEFKIDIKINASNTTNYLTVLYIEK